MVLRRIEMSLNDIKVEGKVYTPVFDTDNSQNCTYCAFRNNDRACSSANLIMNCSDKEVYFVPARIADLRSSTQQMQDWKPSITMQVDESFGHVQQEEQAIGTKYDQDKLQYSLIPSHALEQIAKNLTVGLKKYKERDNWKKVEGAEQRYLDALYRHLEAHRRGELYDADSSVPDMLHMAAVAVNAMFLLEFMLDPKLKEKDNK
jgi:hypothetical protein